MDKGGRGGPRSHTGLYIEELRYRRRPSNLLRHPYRAWVKFSAQIRRATLRSRRRRWSLVERVVDVIIVVGRCAYVISHVTGVHPMRPTPDSPVKPIRVNHFRSHS